MNLLDPNVPTVAIAGDWHGNFNYARRAINYAARHKAHGILHVGDFGIWPGREGESYLREISAGLAKRSLWLGLVDGNHDDHWQLNALPVDERGVRPVTAGITHLPRGFRWTWRGHSWLALGGAISLDRGDRRIGMDYWPEEAISFAEAERAVAPGRVDVIASHDIAANVDTPLAGVWNDTTALDAADRHRELLESVGHLVQPQRWFHGHMHVSYRATVDFAGAPCEVRGLDRDGSPLAHNVAIVDTETLATIR